MAKAPTTEQLRADIDSGAKGEKVSHSDPAAAPLGTDDEAAGRTPTAQERQLAAKSQPYYREPRPPINGTVLYSVILIVVVCIIVLVGYSAR